MPKAPDLRDKQAVEPIMMPPDEFSALIKTDISRWSKLAKECEIELDG